jgi:photosystem II stability/assembly factor-like uncharacterized protein
MLLRRQRGRWSEVPSLPLLGTYRDFWTDGKRSLAVGEQGLVLSNSGTGWKQLESNTPEDLAAVWGWPGGGVAVGTRGTVLRLSNEQVVLENTPTGLDLNDVWAASPQFIIAVGDKGALLRFDGGEWSEPPSGVLEDLHAVGGLTKDDYFIVGAGGTILLTEGGRLKQQLSPISQKLIGVWAGSLKQAFAIADKGSILRFDGSSWQVDHSPASCLSAIYGSPTAGVFAVGCSGTVLAGSLLPRPDSKTEIVTN